MHFTTLNLNKAYEQSVVLIKTINTLVYDRRLRTSIIFFLGMAIMLITISITYHLHNSRLKSLVLLLSSQTHLLNNSLKAKREEVNIPKFEASMKSVGAYLPPLTESACLSNMSSCLAQEHMPNIGVTLVKQDITPTCTIQSLNISFESSFDYEMFNLIEYVLSNHTKFGHTRLREFEIEQIFETSPIVKGKFVYDQLSLIP